MTGEEHVLEEKQEMNLKGPLVFSQQCPPNIHTIMDGDTIIINFRDQRSFIAKLESGKQISIHDVRIRSEDIIGNQSNRWYRINEPRESFMLLEPIDDVQALDYLAIDENMDGELDQTALDDVTQQKLQESDVYQRRTAFAQQKQLKKVRSQHSNLCQIKVADYFHQINRRFLMSDANNFWNLSGATMSSMLQFSGVGHIGGFKRVLVVDDYEGLVSASVCQRLSINGDKRFYGPIFEQFMKFCSELENLDPFIDQEYDEQVLLKKQEEAKQLLILLVSELKIPNFADCSVVCTGRTFGQQLKEALVDTNLIPNKQTYSQFQRLPTNPPTFHVNLNRFVADDWKQEDFGYMMEPNAAAQQKNKEFGDRTPQLTSETLTDLLAYDYCTWVERRMEHYGVPIGAFCKLMRYRIAEGKLVAVSRKQLEPYLSASQTVYFDTLIVASKSRSLPIIQQLMKYMRSGASIVVFSQSTQFLVEDLEWFVRNKNGCRLTAHELVEHQQQFLPGRTHPAMVGQVFGGYVLRGFLQGEPQATSSGEQTKGKRNNRVRQ